MKKKNIKYLITNGGYSYWMIHTIENSRSEPHRIILLTYMKIRMRIFVIYNFMITNNYNTDNREVIMICDQIQESDKRKKFKSNRNTLIFRYYAPSCTTREEEDRWFYNIQTVYKLYKISETIQEN